VLRLKIRQVCLLLGLSLLPISFLVANREAVTTEGQTQISTVLIKLTNGRIGNSYVLDLKEGDVTKDRLSVTLDSETLNLNYSPPPGLVIKPNSDQICSGNVCSTIPSPDTFGTSSVFLRIP
jgi:hypothetical protein